MILKMPNIFHVCLHQDTSFTNRTKSAQSEYSCFTVVFWHLALELVWVFACLVVWVLGFLVCFWVFFFLDTYVSYSFPLSLFFFLFCFNQQQEQTIDSEISFWALWALMLPKHQILQGVLNQRPWCLLLIAQSISPNCSERWQRLSKCEL